MREPSSPDFDAREVAIFQRIAPHLAAGLKAAALRSEALTKREREVVDFVVRGASTKQISRALYISEHTVQEHLSNVFEKVGERGRRALVRRLYLDSLF